MPVLEIENLSYSYPNRPVLDSIHLSVEAGECVGVLGSSGVGKTTLFHLIAGILPLQSGRILLQGKEAQPGEISYMMQKDLLLPHKTVLQNLALPLQLQGHSRSEAQNRAMQELERFHLLEYASDYPCALSGGLRQRFALIRTYLFAQKLFLLDEAFSALDAWTRREFHTWFQEVRTRLQIPVLLITHDLNEAIELCDRIFLLGGKPGRILAEIPITLPADPEEATLVKAKWEREILQLLQMHSSSDP